MTPTDGLALDCSSQETTEQSLAALLNLPHESLHEACRRFDLHRFYEHEWGPARELPKRVLGIKIPRGRYTSYFFHATRVFVGDPLFSDGLLPLGEAIEHIWDSLWSLAENYCSATQWLAFRQAVETNHPSHNAWLYRMKVADPRTHGGPYGFLVRAIPLHKAANGGPWHDYLGIPESIEDICVAFQDSFRVDLAKDYVAATRPCLVKYRAGASAFFVATALLYLCHSIHEVEFNLDVSACHDSHGRRVPASDIAFVEVDPR